MSNSFRLKEIEDKLEILKSDLNSIKGKCSLLNSQIEESEEKIETLKYDEQIFKKAVELLAYVQRATEEKTKEGFESIINYALTFVFQNPEYGINLEFGKRGNLSEMNINLKTPDCKTPFDPMDKDAGGVLNVLSVALRIALLELIKPKMEGFLVLDEPFKETSDNNLDKVKEFLDAINKKINRQIIMVTHKEKLKTNIGNSIEL